MDALLFMLLTLFIVIRKMFEPEKITDNDIIEKNVTEHRIAKLNDSYYEDPNAFSEIINALGFPKGGQL